MKATATAEKREATNRKAVFQQFYGKAGKAVTVLRNDAAGSVNAILTASDPAAAMAQLMSMSRGPYAKAKEDKDKATQKLESAKWRAMTDAMSYHFDKAGMVASWGSFATGTGPYSLMQREEKAAVDKAKREQAAEKNREDAAAWEAEQAAAADQQWRDSDIALAAAHIVGLIQKHASPNSLLDELQRQLAAVSAAEQAKAAKRQEAAAKRKAAAAKRKAAAAAKQQPIAA